MALSTFAFQHNDWYEGTRDGMPVYNGSASGFHDWLFRTEVKAANKNDKPGVMSKIVEGLRGDAQNIAKDIGVTDLLADDGFEKLTEALRKNIFRKSLQKLRYYTNKATKQRVYCQGNPQSLW